jgi:hypothetical protein
MKVTNIWIDGFYRSKGLEAVQESSKNSRPLLYRNYSDSFPHFFPVMHGDAIRPIACLSDGSGYLVIKPIVVQCMDRTHMGDAKHGHLIRKKSQPE